jgi:hypothetical protein
VGGINGNNQKSEGVCELRLRLVQGYKYPSVENNGVKGWLISVLKLSLQLKTKRRSSVVTIERVKGRYDIDNQWKYTERMHGLRVIFMTQLSEMAEEKQKHNGLDIDGGGFSTIRTHLLLRGTMVMVFVIYT